MSEEIPVPPNDEAPVAGASVPGEVAVPPPPLDGETTQALVDRMVDAGEWPEPELLEAIVARGEEAVGPLIEVARQDRHGWPEEAPVCHAIGLLGELRTPAALPAYVDVLRRYDSDTLELV